MKKLFALSLIVAATCQTWVSAADFPIKDKSVTIVVPFVAGGPTDRVARDLAEAMRKPLGATVVVENVAGAGGTIGANKVSKAPQDGHTVLLHHIGMATSPALYRKMPYNTMDDFEFLGMVNEVPMTLVGRPTLPANNYKELVTWIGQNKGKINLANAGLGAASHLCGLMFQQAVQTDMTTVPYKGTAPALNDLMGGQVDLLCDQTTNTSAQIEGKTIKAYGVTTMKRLITPALKDVPTLNESGLKDFNVSIWHGMYAPKGTPKAIVDRLVAALQQSLKDPTIVQRFGDLGTEPVAANKATPAALQAHLAAEIAKWAPLIKKAGTYAD